MNFFESWDGHLAKKKYLLGITEDVRAQDYYQKAWPNQAGEAA